MRVCKPSTITFAKVTGGNVSEPSAGETAWNTNTLYIKGDKAISTTTHRTYESQKGQKSTVTLTIASPGVVNWPGHGLAGGSPIVFSTTGALPTGITSGTTYYVVADTIDTFKLATTLTGAAFNFTGSQSGVHTATANFNKGKDPTVDDGTSWLDVGATNKMAPFDLLRSGGAVGPSPMSYETTPGERIDTFGFYGVTADTVKLEMYVGLTLKKTYTFNLLDRKTRSWSGYYFGRFRYKSKFVITDIPPYSGAKYLVTMTRATGNVNSGRLIPGKSTYIGRTRPGARREGQNFSTIDNDKQGQTVLTPKRYVPIIDQQVRAKKSNVPTLIDLVDDLNAVPALWIGIDDQDSGYFPALLSLGVYTKFAIDADQPDDALVDLGIKEV